MASCENGVWTFEYPSCPDCNKVRRSQGFVIKEADGELCAPCQKAQEQAAYFKSEAYIAWAATVPVGMTMLGVLEWATANPAPKME